MEKECAACGKPIAGGVGIGGVLLCRPCAEDVRVEIDAARDAGKMVNAAGIARRMFREIHGASAYLLKDMPTDLRDSVKNAAHVEGVDMRAWILDACREKLKNKK
jgi:hypothetical protein